MAKAVQTSAVVGVGEATDDRERSLRMRYETMLDRCCRVVDRRLWRTHQAGNATTKERLETDLDALLSEMRIDIESGPSPDGRAFGAMVEAAAVLKEGEWFWWPAALPFGGEALARVEELLRGTDAGVWPAEPGMYEERDEPRWFVQRVIV